MKIMPLPLPSIIQIMIYSSTLNYKIYTQYVVEPKVHSVQSVWSTYVKVVSPKYFRSSKNPTYAQYLSAIMSIMSTTRHRVDPPPPENVESPISSKPSSTSFTNYKRLIVYTAEVKFTNNRYTTPITVEFGSSELENSVNLPVKYGNIFIAIKLLDLSVSITISKTK